ncbi:unnamed protein product [Ilex paraguariensis]|uniref:Uncharacterized protein n=1 Tax=Ilex paraguariensis TaxID=185542 RepID=A0ABC8S8A0_9AQUA
MFMLYKAVLCENENHAQAIYCDDMIFLEEADKVYPFICGKKTSFGRLVDL